MDTNTSTSIPIAKAYSLKELTGWIGKWFSIPANTQGIIIEADGKVRLFPPGKRPVIKPLDRITGKGLGMRVGYIPAGPFDLGARFENLLTGDEEYLDIDLLLNLSVLDPGTFFLQTVVPVGELSELPGLGKQSIQAEMEKTLQQYERDDLIRKIPTERLIAEINQGISHALDRQGMQLLGIPLMLLKRSEDKLLLADKISEVESALADNQAGSQDSQVEKNKVDEVAEDLLPDAAGLRSEGRQSLAELITNLRALRKLENTPKKHWLLKSLQAPDLDGLDQSTAKTLKKLQSLETRWIAFLLIVGLGISYLVYHFRFTLNASEIIGSLVGLWGIIISSVLASLKKIVEKHEALLLRSNKWVDLEKSLLISHEERSEVDALVRQHCANELQRATNLLNESRAQVYQAGRTDLALKIKELEAVFDQKTKRILSADFGTAFYLSGMPISNLDWQKLLDQEEEILAAARILGHSAEKFRLTSPEVAENDIAKLRQQLLSFEDRFHNRSRIN